MEKHSFQPTLQQKLLAAVVLVMTLTIAVFYSVSIASQKRIFNDSFQDYAIGLAQALDAGIGSNYELTDSEKLQSNIYKLIWLSSNIIGISISLPSDGNLLVVASNETTDVGAWASPEGIASYETGTLFQQETVEADGSKALEVITPVHVGGQRVGIYSIKISLITLEKAIAATQRQFLLITLLSLFGVISLLSLSIKYTVVDSIKELLLGMEKIGSGSLSHRVQTKRHDEIGDLFSGLNVMARKLEDQTNELSRAKLHIETIIDNLADGLLEYSRDGKIRRVNRAAERILGISRDTVVGTKVSKSGAGGMQGNPLSALLFPVEGIANVKNGSPADIYSLEITEPLPTSLQVVRISLPKTASADAGYVSIVRDVTREKLIDEDKSNFITIAAHQMRTPLSATKWSLSLLLDDHAQKLTKKVKELVKIAYMTNEHMIGLANDLLVVSRIEDGRYGCTLAEDDVCELIQNISIEYAPLVEKKSLSFSTTCAIAPHRFPFDSARLSIAIHGLIDNAINYTKQGGAISVAVEKEAENAVIRISDSGIGIPEKSLPHIFMKFYRAENAILMTPNGSGLGLYIVKNIITQHGGTITVENNKPQGTTFAIRLPLQANAQKGVVKDKKGSVV